MAKVLVVDDERDSRSFVKEALKSVGYKVEVAINGEACLAKVKTNSYDLVLMDVFMPGLSGREVFDEILKDPFTQDTKVAFFTVAKLSKHKQSELKSLGAVGYIQKPISAEKFIEEVTSLLGSEKK